MFSALRCRSSLHYRTPRGRLTNATAKYSFRVCLKLRSMRGRRGSAESLNRSVETEFAPMWTRLALTVPLLLCACTGTQSPRRAPTPNAVGPPPVESWRQTLGTGCGGPLLALGDTLRCRPVRSRCSGDVCGGEVLGRIVDTVSYGWYSTDESVVRVRNGILRAIGIGHAKIRVTRGDTVGTSDFVVMEPVATIRFERPVYELRIGDTVRICAWAYDSAGNRVRLLHPYGYSARVGYPIEPYPATIPGATGDLVRGRAVGRSVASVSLAHRRDTAVIEVRP